MKKSVLFALLTLFALIPFFLVGQTQIPGGNVSGVWAVAGSPYIIEGSITVDQDTCLIIKPGVTVKFTPGTALSVHNGEKLQAIGTPDSMIIFTSNEVNPSPGSWSRIYLNGTESGSTIQYSIIEYSTYGIYCRAWASGCDDADNFSLIENNEIRLTSERAIFCEGEGSSSQGCIPSKNGSCNPTIKGNKIYDNEGMGIYLAAWDGFQANGYVGAVITNNLIFQNGSDGIRSFWNDPVLPVVANNTFDHNGGSGIHFIGNTDTINYIIENNIFTDNVEGINADNSLTPVIRYNNLWHNGQNYINLNVPIYDISFSPLFVDVPGGDFSLECLSPCINTANPDSPLDPDGTRADMGAIFYDHSLLPGAVLTDSPVCEGDTVNLYATNGLMHYWTGPNNFTSNQQDISFIDAATDLTGEYTLVITDADGCEKELKITVTVNPNPTALIEGDFELCNGDSTTLMASGGTSYQWNTGDTTASIGINPSLDTEYMVTVSSDEGCTGESNELIIVNDLPTASIVGITEFCNGDSTTLTASGGSSYEWNTGSTTASVVVSPSTDTEYIVTVTNDDGCEDESSVLIVVNELPIVLIDGVFELCNGDSTTLTASGGSDYEWSTGSTSSSIEVSPSEDTDYMVTVTNDEGCTSESNALIIVNELPIAVIDGILEFCSGDSSSLIASGGSSYIWSTGDTTTSIIISPSADTEYIVTVTSDEGCTAASNAQIIINELPIAVIDGILEFCSGDSSSLIASGGTSYIWSTGDTTSSIIISPSADTEYIVTVTNDDGCENESSVLVVVNELPIVTLDLEQAIFCADGSEVILLGGIPMGGTYFGQGVTDNTFDPSVVGVDTIPVTYIFMDVNGCTDSATQEVIVEVCVGINNILKKESIQVFPNPSSGNCTILLEGWLGDIQIELIDAQGRVICSEKVSSPKFELTELPDGVYWVKASNEYLTRTRKLIVLR